MKNLKSKKTKKNKKFTVDELLKTINQLLKKNKVEGLSNSKLSSIRFSSNLSFNQSQKMDEVELNIMGLIEENALNGLCNGKPIPPKPDVPPSSRCNYVFNTRSCQWELFCEG
jgi:hypothetical protein